MKNHMTSRDEKRIESDARILKATIEVIADKGYTNANIREIASVAGVTSGLITQRFSTKENLLIQAIHSTHTVWMDHNIPDDLDVEKLLRGIIREFLKIYDRDETVFRFLQVISGSTDIPLNVIYKQRDFFIGCGINKVMTEAQKEGRLLEGNTAVLYNIFFCNTIRLIADFKRAWLDIPDEDFFLSLIMREKR